MQIVWWLLGFYFWLSFNQPLTTICEKIKTLASLVSEISPQLLPYITHGIKFNKFAKKSAKLLPNSPEFAKTLRL